MRTWMAAHTSLRPYFWGPQPSGCQAKFPGHTPDQQESNSCPWERKDKGERTSGYQQQIHESQFKDLIPTNGFPANLNLERKRQHEISPSSLTQSPQRDGWADFGENSQPLWASASFPRTPSALYIKSRVSSSFALLFGACHPGLVCYLDQPFSLESGSQVISKKSKFLSTPTFPGNEDRWLSPRQLSGIKL